MDAFNKDQGQTDQTDKPAFGHFDKSEAEKGEQQGDNQDTGEKVQGDNHTR